MYKRQAAEEVELNVPAFLSNNPEAPTTTGQLEVPRIFEEVAARRGAADELDIPDFLK